MIEIGVNIGDGASGTLAGLISALTGEQMSAFNEVGGRAASNAAVAYHRDFDAAGGWRRKGSARSGRSSFGADVAKGWSFRTADREGAVIGNDADHYGFKVRGGTITPKRVEFLTIPMVDEARGRRVADYEIFTGRRLFRVKGKKALFEPLGKGQGVRAVYALVKQVTQQPWPDAVPPDELIAGAFSVAWRKEMADYIEGR
ncbi:hypothetical protein [Luteolibacter marinus]|uniref:hypothetical protein n=1 Tax=Luteolibacter marinus TaxID=2776705 RepID=UPI0018666791|nr:hypothetical protein [Luteolibacter marinus]